MTVVDGFMFWLGKIAAEFAFIIGFVFVLVLVVGVLEWRIERRRRKP